MNPILKRKLIDRYHILYVDANGNERKNIDTAKEKSDGTFGNKLDEMLRRLRYIFPLGDTEKIKSKRLEQYRIKEMVQKKKHKEMKKLKLKKMNSDSAIVDLNLHAETSMDVTCKDVQTDKYLSN